MRWDTECRRMGSSRVRGGGLRNLLLNPRREDHNRPTNALRVRETSPIPGSICSPSIHYDLTQDPTKEGKAGNIPYASILTPIPKSSYGYLWFISKPSPVQPSLLPSPFVHPCSPNFLIPLLNAMKAMNSTSYSSFFLDFTTPWAPRRALLRWYMSVGWYIFPVGGMIVDS